MTGAPEARRAALRTVLKIAGILAIAYATHRLIGWVEVQSHQESDPPMAGMLALMLLAYALLIAIPFVPGIEIGLAILMMQGAAAAMPVYLATVAGLMLAFLAGRFLPPRWLAQTFADLRLAKPAGLIRRSASLTADERVTLLRESLPGRLGWLAVRGRYLLLALVVNIPGNWVLGGGGGILLVAGMSRVFRTAPTLLTVALAVAPVPLAIWAFDAGML